MNKSPFEVKNEKVAFNGEMNKNAIQESNINSEISLNKAVENLPKVQNDFTKELKNLSTLKQPLEDFFAKIMVNVSEVNIKNNRLALLKKVKTVLFATADLGKLKKRG